MLNLSEEQQKALMETVNKHIQEETKKSCFCIFFADIGVLNTRKFVGICKALLH